MQEVPNTYNSAVGQAETTNKVLRNTYSLLAMTLLFSAITAGISMAVGIGYGVSLMMSIAALILVWFVLPRTANSAKGIWVVFAFTGLLGASLGPILNYYIGTGSGAIVMQALGGTALIFFGLSAYVLTTRKDFSFLGGFLMVGLMVVIFGALGTFVAGMFGVDVSVFSLAISALVIFVMSGFILYDTSRIINGGETNYIMATVSLYISIYNIFTSLLHLLGAAED